MTTQRDAELSALLDGALEPSAEAALRGELARDPVLAARLEELAAVDEALRALPARPVPADLRARLQARIEAESPRRVEASARTERTRGAAGRGRTPGARTRRFTYSLAAAAAAALALVVLPRLVEDDSALQVAGGAPEPRAADSADPRASGGMPGAAHAPELAPPPSPETRAAELAAAEPREEPPQAGREPDATEPASSALASTSSPAVTDMAEAGESPEQAGAAAALPMPSDLAAADAAPSEGALLTEEEAAALEGLELEDASVVAVLDLLGALGALDGGAS